MDATDKEKSILIEQINNLFFSLSLIETAYKKQRNEILTTLDNIDLNKKSYGYLQKAIKNLKKYSTQFNNAATYQEEIESFYITEESEPDLGYFFKYNEWTVEQATAISLGKTPSELFSSLIIIKEDVSLFAKEYKKRHDLISHHFANKPIKPYEFIRWCFDKKILIMPALLNQMTEISTASKIEIHPRTEKNYQRLIGALLGYISGDVPNVKKHLFISMMRS